MVRADAIFAATGVTNGALLDGVTVEGGFVHTHTLVMNSATPHRARSADEAVRVPMKGLGGYLAWLQEEDRDPSSEGPAGIAMPNYSPLSRRR